jgi:hypothetical protein
LNAGAEDDVAAAKGDKVDGGADKDNEDDEGRDVDVVAAASL